MIHEHCDESTRRPIPGSVTSASDYVGPRRLALSVLRSSSLSLARVTARIGEKKDTRRLCFLAVRLILELDTYYAHRVICRGACAFSFNQIFGG